MKAWHFDRFGPPDVLELRNAPDPIPEPNEVVIRVIAASVHPADAKVRSGVAPAAKNLVLPHILGRDFSGLVEQVGAEVTDFAIGDAIFGVLDVGQEGAYAEKLAARADLAARKPDFLTHIEAAALSLSGLTALVALEDLAKLQRDQRILIQGGAGGVGSIAVQYAHHVGAKVFATASARNYEYLRDLGADAVIDYNAAPFEHSVSDCDIVFDTVGGEVHRRSFAVLKPGGLMVHIAPPPPDMEPPSDVRVARPNVRRDRAHMERLVELVEQAALRPPAIDTIPFSEAPRAHEMIETGHVRGKLVLAVSKEGDR